jgi:hypothetical protein
MRTMSETSEPSIQPSPVRQSPAAAPPPPTSDWLYRVAAWVAIIAGLIFITLASLWLVCAFWN